jgi:MFS family permease
MPQPEKINHQFSAEYFESETVKKQFKIKGNPTSTEHAVTLWLRRQNPVILTVYISVLAFLTYACMYGLRKPFTVASFEGITLGGMDYKALLIISQVIGYALSKFIGIKVISEMGRSSRAISIIVLTGIAETALILFSIVPDPYNIILLFFNGLPLGMIWGLVFAYLEGRRTTEILGTVLSISFIVSSGFVKSIGNLLMKNLNLTDFQMPWVTGMVFFIPLAIFVWLLDKTPEPTPEDEALRTKRVPMDKRQRQRIFSEFAPGLVLLTIAYILLTIYRDLRDNFAAEIWSSIGISGNSMIFTWSELPIALSVFVVMGSLMLVSDNRKALRLNNFIILAGFLLIGLSTAALNAGIINPVTWMILLGLGTYLGYLPFNCFLFDRLIAAFGSAANAGFFIYIADSFGYLGSVGTLLYKNFSSRELSWFNFLTTTSYSLSIAGSLLIISSLLYFRLKFQKNPKVDTPIKESKFQSITT